MRSLFFGLLCASALASVPAQARVSWIGSLMFTSASSACDFDMNGRLVPTVRFRPVLAGTDNGPNSRLVLHDTGGAEAFVVENGSFTSLFKTVATMGVYEGFSPFDNPVQVRFTFVSPAFSTTADFVNVRGFIKGYNEDADCIYGFKMALFQRME